MSFWCIYISYSYWRRKKPKTEFLKCMTALINNGHSMIMSIFFPWQPIILYMILYIINIFKHFLINLNIDVPVLCFFLKRICSWPIYREFVKMNSNFFKNVETNVHKDPNNLDFSYDIVNTLCWWNIQLPITKKWKHWMNIIIPHDESSGYLPSLYSSFSSEKWRCRLT